ncbi:unnamed protein product (macronuclear) [Paramecium tetraurelia]|uniref:Uncharacterized protein n=1 Tax=Paramecium tetraurelia TaxID=5888 RepID=A0BWU7_PARTE|nr:uncharacterized protein GSPATT00032866001 [Paramecium tetraurelia]CAK63014.1 unnamed protein product [Paramecium tetraurelia]|eukprot:XP_001430412.1 hypothetical protein (macronuclear) [Paramecium tetraurelia strain d4-2]
MQSEFLIHNLNSFKNNAVSYLDSETFEEFQKRQKDYDKLEEYPYHTRQTRKTLDKYHYSNTAKEIKQYFFKQREIQKIISTSKTIMLNNKKQPKKRQFNLLQIIMIIIPILQVMTILTELL